MKNYKKIAKQSRIKVLKLIYSAQTSHIGSNFSCADILAVLFEKIDLDKDIFVLSAGWKAAMLYYHLWRKERITEEELNSYCQPGSKFIGLAEPICKDIKIAGGSMGLGLPGAVGLALAKKVKNENGRVYCLMSDGEQAIGTTHESALIARHHNLNNLAVIVDYNKLQAMGRPEDILRIAPLTEIWSSYGWEVIACNGHNYDSLENSLSLQSNKPLIILANTIKGKGVTIFEDNNEWHYRAPNKEHYEQALKELNV